jgi:bifunctional non-homologous end joining protein LigD
MHPVLFADGEKPKAHWLKPELLVDVEYRALTGEGKVRHPSFKGIREDLWAELASHEGII